MSDTRKHVRIADDKTAETTQMEAYYLALGRFVHMFAKVELTTFLVLRHYARMTLPAARALLSGIRMDGTQSMLRRLQEIDLIDQVAWADADMLLKHLSDINKFRNDILHHTTMLSESGRGIVTNAAKAHREDKVTQLLVSPDILNGATADLRKIMVHLHVRHMGKTPIEEPEVDLILRAPWRYTPRSSPQATAPPSCGTSRRRRS